MKKFFAVIPLQPKGRLEPYHYEAMDNKLLELESKTCFPILTALNGYAEKGEEIRMIVVLTDEDNARYNYGLFEAELEKLCRQKGVLLPRGLESILVPNNSGVSAQVAVFQQLIDYAEDEDELFASVTFGTKPISTALMTAIQYAYSIKRNTSLGCIVYGEVDRSGGPENWKGKVYDQTALVQMNELIHMLAEQKVPDPKQVIDRMLSL